MLMSTFALTVFALRHHPLVERSCCVYSCVDPNAPRHRCCCCCCHHLCIVVIIGVSIVLVTATSTIAELTPPVDPSCIHFPQQQQACLHLLSFMLIVA
jgi:hypothetical protein